MMPVSRKKAAIMSVPFVTAPLDQNLPSSLFVQRLSTHSTSGASFLSMGNMTRGAVARLPARIPDWMAGRIPEQMVRTAEASLACLRMKACSAGVATYFGSGPGMTR